MPELGKATYTLNLNSTPVNAGMKATEAQVNRSVASIGKKLGGLEKGLSDTGRKIATGVSLPVVAIAAGSALMAVKFEDEMGKIRDTAGATEAELMSMTKRVLDFAASGETTQGPMELAKALYRVESAGIRGGAAMEYLEVASKGATLGASDLEQTTYALVAAQMTGIRGTETLANTMGMLNAIIGAGNLRMEDLTGALSTGVLPAAKAVGLGLQDVGAAIDVFTSRGIPAQAAATRLRMTFAQMASPTSKAAGALKEIGLGERDLAQTMRGPGGLPAAIELLQSKLEKIPDPTKRASLVLEAFGGGRTGAAMLILLQNVDSLRQKYDQVGKKTSEFGLLADEALTGPAERTEKAWASMQAAMIRLGFILLPMIAEIADAAADAAEWFDKLGAGTKKWVFVIAGGLAVLGPVLLILGGMVGAISAMVTAFAAIAAVSAPVLLVAAAVAALVGALVAAKVAPKEFASLLERLGLSATQAAAVVKGLAIAFDVTVALIKGTIAQAENAVRLAMSMIENQLDIVIGFLTLDFARAWKGVKGMVMDPLNFVVGFVKNWKNTVVSVFESIWIRMKEIAFRGLLKIIEPFSHLPRELGRWARKAKDAMGAELAAIDAKQASSAATKLAENFGISFVPAMAEIGKQGGNAAGESFLQAFSPWMAAAPKAAPQGSGPMAVWNERKKKWVDEAGKVLQDQQTAWDALMRERGPVKPKRGQRVDLTPPVPKTTPGAGLGGGDDPGKATNLLPANLRLAEAQAGSDPARLKRALAAEAAWLENYLDTKKLTVEQRIEATTELNRVNDQIKSINEGLVKEIEKDKKDPDAFDMPKRLAAALKIAEATPGTKDNMKQLKIQERFLEGLLKGKKMTLTKRAAIRTTLKTVTDAIDAINNDILQKALGQPLQTAQNRIAQAKAERTKSNKDDIKAENANLARLRKMLRELGKGKEFLDKRAEIEEAITASMNKIKELKEEQVSTKEEEARATADMRRLLANERVGFFASFGSDIFQQSPAVGGGGGLQPSRMPGSAAVAPAGPSTEVTINQNFPEKTDNLMREAMYAETAFKHRFEGESQ